MTRKNKISAIIVAAGRGRRFGSLKQFAPLCGKPVYEWSLDALFSARGVSQIIVAVPAGMTEKVRKAYAASGGRAVKRGLSVKFVAGGSQRFDSVANALNAVSDTSSMVLVHDGARPLVTQKIIADTIRAAAKQGAALAAMPATDTVKISSDGGRLVSRTVPRSSVFMAQTPQVFGKEIIMRAYERPDASATDDSYLVENIGIQPALVAGSAENFKITTRRDMAAAEAILLARKKVKR
ncbi:MAG: 2-C-methyl-D-erythritol 4-phosphate cytidylyltransferase [Elusimicrobia bacterium HGW-Elusimicrobia-1]|jgi:2-C-methyl-D-erythritol 4-phosphate cytidylyltransferase|nr:MAG: 2-C-methyl-D-erythritol 4-phosphate cytidylyltransferase [Elusimicrobia bacterium HGW-Elusimicrobia-1]